MKMIHYVLPITAVFLLFIGVQMNFAAVEKNMSNTKKVNEEQTKATSGTRKILVAYFSHSGNTREIANQIHENVGGDIFEIQSVKTYPNDYDKLVKQAKKEQDSEYKPELKTKVNNMKQYDIIFIGYPNWWGTFPAPVKTFFSEYDFSGKTIVPFCTHEESGFGRSVADISKLCPTAILLDGITVRGGNVKTSQGKVSDWLKKIKILK